MEDTAQEVTYRLFVGIDIAAASATVVSLPAGGKSSRPRQIPQTPQGYAELHTHLQESGIPPAETLVVMEATGSYWISLATALVAAGYGVSVVNPSQAHDVAKALLKRAKTGAIDAQTLAQRAALLQPDRWTPPPAVYAELQQRLAQRDTLLALRQQVRNQLQALLQGPVVIAAVRQRLEVLIAPLSAQILEVEAEIAPVLQQDAAWAHAAARLQSIKGIGLLTATWLLVTTLNFSACPTAEAAVAYAGLAPYGRASGTSVHQRPRIGHTGNGRLRTALYMASLSAARTNRPLTAFYTRLCAAGKPAKVARCAVARKLLHQAWAVVTKDRDFDPTYLPGRTARPAVPTP
jgi:transposase